MEVKIQVLYSVLLGRDHHDRRPPPPTTTTTKPRGIRFGIRLSKVEAK